MSFEVGQHVDHYRVDHVVHTGRFTVVYAASDITLGRKTALKVLADHYADDPNFRDRFVREVQVAGSLDGHPNMVTVYGWGEAGGTLYLATQFVEGVTLDELLRQQPGGEPLPPEEALEYLRQIASALDYAHARQVVHRDVKPANVLISMVDRPHLAYLVDFGVTKDIADNAKPTHHGLFLGTAEYASPEQISGAAIDGRADVYSLACTAFELLTGSSPYAAGPDDSALIAAHLQAEIPSAVARRPSLPDGVDRVLMRALAKHPDARPASAGELVRGLTDAFAESTVLFARPTAPTAAPLPPPMTPRRRRWWIPAVIGGAAALIVAACVYLFVLRDDDDDNAGPPPTSAAPSTSAPPSTTAPPTTTTQPPTTPPTTTVPPSTLPPVPAGAVDLGYGVYVPLAEGWQVAALDENAAQLTDGTTTVSFVLRKQAPGSTVKDAIATQVPGVDDTFPAVWWGTPQVAQVDAGALAAQRASVEYRAIGDGGQTSGEVLAAVRADGLAVGYAQYAAAGASSTAYPARDEMLTSFTAAPEVAEPAEIADPGAFNVTSSHPQLRIDGIVGFTPAPDYRVVDVQSGYAFVAAGGGEHEVITRAHTAGSPEELVHVASQSVGAIYPGVAFGPQTNLGADDYGIIRTSIPMSATDADGRALVGTLDTYWNPVTTHGYWLSRMWFATPDGAEPYAAQAHFMASLLYESFHAAARRG